MAKFTETLTIPLAETAPGMTVAEFCRRKSETLSRTELIAAFFSDESRAGRIKDTAEAFEARFQQFINKPA